MRHFISVVLLFFSLISFSQKEKSENIQLVDRISINIYHNPHDLAKLGKHPLKRIYIKRVIAFMELLPFLSHQLQGSDTDKQLEVPMNKSRKKLLKKNAKIREKFYSNLNRTLDHTINYADKEDIINRIILIDNAIGNIFTHLEDK